MSAYNSQEFDDYWDDIPASFQEQILQNVAQLEAAAFASKSSRQENQSTTSDPDTRHNKKQKHGSTNEKTKTFQVYKDPVVPTIESTTPSAKRKHLQDWTNQQQPTHQCTDKHESPKSKVTTIQASTNIETTTVADHTKSTTATIDQSTMDDDDDSMWPEFDDMDISTLLQSMEKTDQVSNSNNNKDTTGLDACGTDDSTTILAQYDTVLETYGGFQTAGSKKDIKPSDNSLKAAHDKALALMAEPLSPTTTTATTETTSPNIPPPLGVDNAPVTSTTHPDTPKTAIPAPPLPDFGFGFSTARGTKLNEPSLDAKLEAQQLLLDSPTRSSSTSSLLDGPHSITSGFSTGRGTKLNEPSAEAKRKAQQLLENSPTRSTSSSPPLQQSTSSTTADIQSTTQDQLNTSSLLSIHQYEDVIQQYGGFSKASGKKSDTVISETAKQQALLLFSNDISSTQKSSTQQESHQNDPNASNRNVDSHQSSSNATLMDTLSSPSSSLSSCTSSLMTTTSLSSADIQAPPPDQIIVSQSSPTISPLPETTTTKPTWARKRRQAGTRPQSKPFKSPTVNLELVKAGLEKRNATSNLKKVKGPPVFDLHFTGCRRPLSSLGTPRKYTKVTLESMNIPLEIIDMTPCKARSYMFENHWGVQEATNELIANGALSSMLPLGWVENHYGWIVFKLARHLAMFAHHYKNDVTEWWSPAHIVKQLLYRYERDINLGHRSVLKRILEQDDVPIKQMVLMVADIISLSKVTTASGLSGTPSYTPSKKDQQQQQQNYRLQMTDGWYQISTFVDARMNKMIDQGRVYVGQKLVIFGAQLLGDRTPKTPLEALTMANTKSDPTFQHDSTTTSLQISSNSCLPCAWDTKMGYPRQRHRRHAIRRLDTNVYEDGGMITMMEVVICKKYPMMYSETLANGMTMQRNSKDEEDYRRTLEIRQQASQSLSSASSASHLEKSVVSDSQDRRVSGYFRLRVCDVNKNKNHSQVQATLMVSKATEVIHMDLLEGQCYRVFFVQPYEPKSRLLDGPYLITTRLTKWEPLSPKPTIAPSSKDASAMKYPLRSICPCANIRDLNGTDADIVVLVLHSQPQTSQLSMDGRNIWYSTLLVTDSSLMLCQVTYRSYYRLAQDIEGQILGLMNVRFDTYDSKCDIIHIKSSDETEIWSKPIGTMPFLQHGMMDLKKWIESHPYDIASIQQRVNNLIQ